MIRHDLERVVIATLRDDRALAELARRGAKAGDRFDMEVGGYLDGSAGKPVRVRGTLEHFEPGSADGSSPPAAHVRFGRGNLLMLSPQLVQVTSPARIHAAGVDVREFDVFAIKSRVHFRRGFDDTGYAPTILLVEPPGTFMGTVHLDALAYRNIRPTDFFPFGSPAFDLPPEPTELPPDQPT